MAESITKEATAPAATETNVSAKAYEFVALSASLAVQDAADNLRNINTMCSAAMGIAMAQMLENPASASEVQNVLDKIRQMQEDSARHYQLFSNNVTTLLSELSKK